MDILKEYSPFLKKVTWYKFFNYEVEITFPTFFYLSLFLVRSLEDHNRILWGPSRFRY